MRLKALGSEPQNTNSPPACYLYVVLNGLHVVIGLLLEGLNPRQVLLSHVVERLQVTCRRTFVANR